MEQHNPGKMTDVNYWTERQEKLTPINTTASPKLYAPISRFMPTGSNFTCLEVGVYPGGHLLYLAQTFGYQPVGVDFSPNVSLLTKIFRQHHIEGEFIQADFFEWDPRRLFDVVVSHGFIEHFEDYAAVVDRHWELVKPGGIMIISTPVFTPYQYIIRKICFTSSQWDYIIESHNFKAMNLRNLCSVITELSNGVLLSSGYTHNADFWYSANSKGIRPITRPLFVPIKLFERIVRKLALNGKLISPNNYVVAKKSST